MKDILDEITNQEIINKSVLFKIFVTVLFAVLFSSLMSLLLVYEFIPGSVFNKIGGVFSIMAGVYFFLFFYLFIKIPIELNKIVPMLSEFKVVIYSLFIFIIFQFFVKLFQLIIYGHLY